ncbi:flagellin B [Campylobacter sp.]|uniref:flagellin B n=1 Tax=Campylobacter sp. TaxID=205 RepID=UPI002A5444C9|nr:flagellin B [Campylobacter sp.]MDD7090148.1 flagellin B [Campylobacteraceae bacterium]MDY5284876.1 flagellin B [Campylobacter sp.]
MAFRINTNITALNNHNNARKTDDRLNASLTHLSSGLRVNKAADDASGMTIADSLKSQANSLGQAIANGNDAIGIVQTADGAMDEQLQIVDTIRTKAIQAAQDGQSTDSRKALQADISRLMEELDNIAKTTSFNGKQLLNGNFSNQNFQIGAYSNETVQISIGATESSKIGHTRFETSRTLIYSAGSISTMTVQMELSGIDGFPNGYKFQDIKWEELKADGLKAVVDRLNGVSDTTGVRAKVTNAVTFSGVIETGSIKGLEINGAKIGEIEVIAGDTNAVLANAINAVKAQTGVEASVTDGRLTLTARDGRAINMKADSTAGANVSVLGALAAKGLTQGGLTYLGNLSLIREDARDIVIGLKTGSAAVSANQSAFATISAAANISTAILNSVGNTATVTLKDLNTGVLKGSVAAAMGYFHTGQFSVGTSYSTLAGAADQLSGVTTYGGAQAMISVAESAQKQLDRIRADIGSVQNQIVATINNISTTQVNVKAAESQIRDVDFASEASNFNKYNLLAQSGSYALSQANTIQQNVMRLLQ